ncbi:hypothetical protein P7K49_016168 [Saguinus oedipus]|uniref:Multifunctional methyltransferase subunit TRM112-like protein n=1 Tax=Saguinus oedipus TaxID=9490 RepID=A0ABQ9VBB1_SAGOE|nr:hypothetical protein P7K49_016168 [Saguinus oedipus]
MEFNPQFMEPMIPKVECAAFLEVADNLQLIQVPKGPVKGYKENEDFLRTMHHLLLEVEVVEGTLQCPESGRMFPINCRVPNMLLSEDESEN